MRWWCAAQGVPWEWTWRPYPGVWAFVALLVLGYWLLVSRRVGTAAVAGGRGASTLEDGPGLGVGHPETAGGRVAAYLAGTATLWLALDWPVGALGSGYLASVHMVQFLLIALVAPPLLLYGIPPAALDRLRRRPAIRRFLRVATHPLVAIVLFNAVVAATHWPSVVDGLMASQLGSFAIDMAWLAGGLAFWWPVTCPVPERPGFTYPLKIGYLILNTVVATLPYAFLTFGRLPFYATYELAPPVAGISARTDQQVAGLLMKLGGGAVLWTAIAVLFLRWWRREEAEGDAAP